ncbi:hypothetical protein EVAR_10054_1 [Eumeta japonica]|uniref:Uncharacterized protein n=1 Tax=Eumeta variegata TaxID=151549 RepID=A0A4C1TR62_EUMVA|nr:hypothetical protein EVAR_10054_1 [Eumeta japonica]
MEMPGASKATIVAASAGAPEGDPREGRLAPALYGLPPRRGKDPAEGLMTEDVNLRETANAPARGDLLHARTRVTAGMRVRVTELYQRVHREILFHKFECVNRNSIMMFFPDQRSVISQAYPEKPTWFLKFVQQIRCELITSSKADLKQRKSRMSACENEMVLKQPDNNKALGVDGITTELLKVDERPSFKVL